MIWVRFAMAPRESLTDTIIRVSYLPDSAFNSALGSIVVKVFWLEKS